MAGSTPTAPQSGRRPYRSPLRQAKARRTRARILEAATQLFRTQGYAGTTVAAVAAAAEVSVATVELAFPTKHDLLKAAIDLAIAGDDEPVPVLERPWAASARAAPDATAFLDAVATILVPAAERSDALVLAALEGARSDNRLVPLAAQLSAQRAVTAGWIVDGLTEKTPLRPASTAPRPSTSCGCSWTPPSSTASPRHAAGRPAASAASSPTDCSGSSQSRSQLPSAVADTLH